MKKVNETQIKKLNQIVLNKLKHSNIKGGREGEDIHFEDLNFKFSSNKNRKESYLNKFKPALYYEWSKRQNENEPMLLGAIFIRNSRVFNSINLFELNSISDDIFTQLKLIDKRIKKFHFEDMKVYFFIYHPSNAEDWRVTNLEKFLFEQKEADLNLQIEELEVTYGRKFHLYGEDEDGKTERIEFLTKEVKNLSDSLIVAERRYNSTEFYNVILKRESTNLKRRLGRLRRQSEEASNGIETYKSDECVICYIEKPNVMFCNCGHIAICENCNELTTDTKCPVCRQESTIKRKI